MELTKNIIVFLPLLLGVLGFIFLIPGSIISGDIARETIKNYNPTFTSMLSDVKGDLNDNVRSLWITFGLVAAFIGLVSAILTRWFPLGFGKALLLNSIIAGFVCIAFNVFTMLAVILFIASGTVALLQKRE